MKQSNQKPKEIEMQTFEPRNLLNLVYIPIVPPRLNLAPIKFDVKECLLRTPKKIFQDPLPANADDHAVGVLPDALWVEMFSFMDIATQTAMMLSCKKMAHLLNANKIRKKRFEEKFNYTNRMQQMQQINRFFNSHGREREVSAPSQALPPALLSDQPADETYHPGRDGENNGFVMKGPFR